MAFILSSISLEHFFLEDSPRLDSAGWNRGEGSKISRVCQVVLTRPVKQCTKCRIRTGMPVSWQRHGRWTAMPGPACAAYCVYLGLQTHRFGYMTARRALNPCDNGITSDQNCHKLLLFPLLRVKHAPMCRLNRSPSIKNTIKNVSQKLVYTR